MAKAALAGRLPAKPRRPSPHGLRIGAIDIGTNSMHMVVVEVTDSLSFRVLASEKEMTRLGASALIRHRLTQSAMVHTDQVLARYQRIARQLDAEVVLAYATSAVRECVNGPDFVELLKLDLGLDIQVISAMEEARLIYLAVRQAVDLPAPTEPPVMIVDIGGGSAEFIIANAERALLLQSRKLGASRLAQQFVGSDPVSKGDLRRLEKHIDQTLRPIFRQAEAAGVRRVIGTSGTMENLVAMCLGQHGEEVSRHRVVTEMRREDFEGLYKALRRMRVEQRRRLPGLDPKRADQIVAGAAVVDYVFERLEVEAIEVCDRAMREGMIIDYMEQHWPKIRLAAQVRDPRRRAILELGRRCNFDEQHATQVARLALMLFDQLAGLHKLSAEARELLEFAAIVHDIGWHIGHHSHHKHSWYLIKNGDLEGVGFSPVEIDIIANVARYHRRSEPKKSHEAFMALLPGEREVVRKLSAILRLADGLDRGHSGNVRKVSTIVRKRSVTLRVETGEDPELEVWAARHKAEVFERVYGRKLSVVAKQVATSV